MIFSGAWKRHREITTVWTSKIQANHHLPRHLHCRQCHHHKKNGSETASERLKMLRTERRFFSTETNDAVCTRRVYRTTDDRDDSAVERPFQLSSSRKNY
jgi:hypothetical protein